MEKIKYPFEKYIFKIGDCWVNEEKKLMFIDIPKNASQTIKLDILKINNFISGKNYYSYRDIDEFFKFAVLRNPIKRLYSIYKEITLRCKMKETKKDFLKMAESIERFIRFLEEAKEEYFDEHMAPQYIILDNMKVDMFLFVENLENDVRILCDKFNLKRPKRLSEKNKSPRGIISLAESYFSHNTTHPYLLSLYSDIYKKDEELYNKETKKRGLNHLKIPEVEIV